MNQTNRTRGYKSYERICVFVYRAIFVLRRRCITFVSSHSSILKNLLLSLLRFSNEWFIHGTHSFTEASKTFIKNPSYRNFEIAIFNCKTTVIYACLIWRFGMERSDAAMWTCIRAAMHLRDYLYLFFPFCLQPVK